MEKNIVNKHFQKDFNFFLRKYKKFSLNKENNQFQVIGNLPIVDQNGYQWGEFFIKIELLPTYPFYFPKVYEIGNRIKYQDYKIRHINPDGSCCVCVEPIQIIEQNKGLTLTCFIENYVLPFFAHQIIFEIEGRFLSEYSHGNEGIKEFFFEKIGSQNIEIISKTFRYAITRQKIKRNEYCYCGSNKKIKKCHLRVISFLRQIDNTNLIHYSELMKKHIAS